MTPKRRSSFMLGSGLVAMLVGGIFIGNGDYGEDLSDLVVAM